MLDKIIEMIFMGIVGLVMLLVGIFTGPDIQFVVCGGIIFIIAVGFIVYSYIKNDKNLLD